MRRAALLFLSLLASCAVPLRQYDIHDKLLSCDQANSAAVRTLQVMHFTITGVEPAAVGHPGTVHGTREEAGSQQPVRVDVGCNGSSVDVVASEESRLYSSIEFKRAFFLAFGAVADAQAREQADAQAEAALPLAQKRNKGLQVLLRPLPGFNSRLDLGIDMSQSGVLPVRVTITNSTPRSVRFSIDDIVLLRKDGARVQSVDPATAAASVSSHIAGGEGQAVPTPEHIKKTLAEHALQPGTVSADQQRDGFLYFPAGDYTRGRATFEDVESEETEGFFVEF